MTFIRYTPPFDVPFNQRAMTYVFEDYFSTTTPTWATTSHSGTGSGILQTGAVTNDLNIGTIGLYTGTTTTGRGAFGSHVDGIQFGANQWTFETRANVLNLSDATNTYTVRFGFMDSITAEPTDGHFIRYTHGTNSGKWQAVTRINNVETATDTGETATAMTNGSPMNRWKIIVDNSGTSVDFYLNDRRIVTHSPSGFTGSSRLTGIGYSMIKSAGTTSRALIIDYTLINCHLGTHR